MRKLTNYLTLAILPLTICLAICIINFTVAQGNVYKLPFVTSRTIELQDIVTYKGFGVTMNVLDQKGQDDIVKENTIVYNELAGNIENWDGEMNIDQYEVYKDDLVNVNGQIVNSDKQADYIEYTFDNNKRLEVYFIRSNEQLDKYSHDIDSANVIEELPEDENGNTVYKYNNGVVKVVNKQVISGQEPLKIKMNYNIDVFNLIVHYIVLLGITMIVYLIAKILKGNNTEEKNV